MNKHGESGHRFSAPSGSQPLPPQLVSVEPNRVVVFSSNHQSVANPGNRRLQKNHNADILRRNEMFRLVRQPKRGQQGR
jgi:hypothetical protein